MTAFSPRELEAEIAAALSEFRERERRLSWRVRISPAKWEQDQYSGGEIVWVVAVMGGNCLYNNHVEEGWGWGRFET